VVLKQQFNGKTKVKNLARLSLSLADEQILRVEASQGKAVKSLRKDLYRERQDDVIGASGVS